MRNRQVLRQGWYFKQLDNDHPDIRPLSETVLHPDDSWTPITTMPAQIHDILFSYGLIPDPHIGKNAAECTWVGEKDWAYCRSFDTPPGSGAVLLRFNGLDTDATIYLNGKLIGGVDNMNRRYALEVRRYLRPLGELNALVVIFSSPIRHIQGQEIHFGKTEGIPTHMYIRKSLMDFVDYLGARPFFPKVGIFADVTLDVPDRAWFEDVWVRPRLADDFSRADVAVSLDVSGLPGQVDWVILDAEGRETARGTTDTQAGGFDFTLNNPRLWWPCTHGKPELYTLKLTLTVSGETCDERSINFGVRRIRSILKDPESGENRFSFEVNGTLIFLKGACLAPVEGMTHCWSSERAKRLLDLAEQGHMNILRVWADGELHDDEFYDECDRRGFLVWQDFMFGYGIHPVWLPGYAQRYRLEAEDTIRRLRNHPCILLWCGGNENLMMWDFTYRQEAPRGRELFEEIVPQVCARLDPDRLYHPSSPSLGRVPNWPLEGDWHDYTWSIWSPQASVPLFASETGCASPPSLTSMRRFMSDEEIWPGGFSPAIRSPGQTGWPPMWEYRSVPGAWIKVGPVEQFCDPASPEELIRNLGTAHGEYLQRRIERHRRGVPDGASDGKRRCWGNMIWRLNDSWPIIYFAAVDYYLEPKIAYYFLKRAYAPVLVSFEQTADTIAAWVVNDSPTAVSGRLTLRLRSFDGAVLGELSKDVEIAPGVSHRCLDATDLGVIKLRNEFLQAGFNGQEYTFLLTGERHLQLPRASLSARCYGGKVEVSTDLFARQVTLIARNVTGAVYEDNYFDLAPGQTRTIEIINPAGASEIRISALNAPKVWLKL